MPFTNPFKKPSTTSPSVSNTLNSPIFPPTLITYTLIRALLLAQTPYPTLFHTHLQTSDIQQLLTELYGYEASLHWTWIGCTFHPSDVKKYLSSLPSSSSSKEETKLGSAQKKALLEFVKKTHIEEGQRKERYLREKGSAAMEAYVEGERKRKDAEVKDLERIVRIRLEREGKGPRRVKGRWVNAEM